MTNVNHTEIVVRTDTADGDTLRATLVGSEVCLTFETPSQRCILANRPHRPAEQFKLTDPDNQE